MALFSFKKQKKLKCDWCKKEIQKALYIKHTKNKKFVFCSDSCKQNFRKSGQACAYNRTRIPCPSCPN